MPFSNLIFCETLSINIKYSNLLHAYFSDLNAYFHNFFLRAQHERKKLFLLLHFLFLLPKHLAVTPFMFEYVPLPNPCLLAVAAEKIYISLFVFGITGKTRESVQAHNNSQGKCSFNYLFVHARCCENSKTFINFMLPEKMSIVSLKHKCSKNILYLRVST